MRRRSPTQCRLVFGLFAIASCTASPTTLQPAGATVATEDAGTDQAPSGTPSEPSPDLSTLPSWQESDWPQYRHDIHSTWHLPARFAATDALALVEKWHVDLGPYGYSEPIIVGDTVFVTMGFSGKVFALAAADGHTRWSRELNHVFHPACTGMPLQTGFYASPALIDGVLYVVSPDGNLYALNPGSGVTEWNVAVATPDDEFVESSPVISRMLGKIYLGVASVTRCGPTAGRVLSVDLATHAVVSQSLVPTGETGAGVWSSISIDESAGRIYVTTGDPGIGILPTDRPNSQSFLALDPITLEILDHWQNDNPADDLDFGASPTLLETAAGSLLVASASKDGNLYVLARGALASGPLWSWPIAVGGDPIATAGGKGSLVAPTFANQILYAAGGQTAGNSAAGHVFAFDPSTTRPSSPKWMHTTPGYVLAGMPAVGDILVVAVTAQGNMSGTLEVLKAATGDRLNSFLTDAPLYGAPVIGRGLIVFVDFNGRVTALGL